MMKRIAAIQMQPELGDVTANLRKANELVNEALAAGAKFIILPELFTTGVAFDDSMISGYRPLKGEPMQLLKKLAAEGGAAIGGSFLAESEGHVYNSFVLATADGQVFTHDKDFPSGPIEHAYYAGGEDSEFIDVLRKRGIEVSGSLIPPRPDSNPNGLFSLGDEKFGVALCWEMIRNRTVNRLKGNVDFVIASSAWGTIDPDVGFPGLAHEQVVDLNDTLTRMIKRAPKQLAMMLGVPVAHANLVGPQRAVKLFDQDVETVTDLLGESAIFDCDGQLIARRGCEEGEGVLVADVPIEKCSPKEIETSDNFWIPKLSPILQDFWYAQGAVGREYYLNVTQPSRHGE